MGEGSKIADRGRPSEQISLRLVAKFVAQEMQLRVGLDAFRQHRQTEPAYKTKHRPYNGRGLIVGIDRLNERTVDLDLVERKCAQVRERRIAGAEIVHGDANTECFDQP